MKRTEIRVAGFGGQGVILCAMIIGKAASIHGGRHATLVQSFGPEARGSACSASVIVDDHVVDYPYVKKPDILVVMSPDAYKLFAPQVKPGGTILYESDLITLDKAATAGMKTFGVPATRLAEELGRRMIMNIAMCGFFAGVTNLIESSAIEAAVLDSVPRGTEELNMKAFRRGYEFGLEQRNAVTVG